MRKGLGTAARHALRALLIVLTLTLLAPPTTATRLVAEDDLVIPRGGLPYSQDELAELFRLGDDFRIGVYDPEGYFKDSHQLAMALTRAERFGLLIVPVVEDDRRKNLDVIERSGSDDEGSRAEYKAIGVGHQLSAKGAETAFKRHVADGVEKFVRPAPVGLPTYRGDLIIDAEGISGGTLNQTVTAHDVVRWLRGKLSYYRKPGEPKARALDRMGAIQVHVGEKSAAGHPQRVVMNPRDLSHTVEEDVPRTSASSGSVPAPSQGAPRGLFEADSAAPAAGPTAGQCPPKPQAIKLPSSAGELRLTADCGETEKPASGLDQALTAENPGGVDFTSLELRFLADGENGEGLRYAFTAPPGSQRGPTAVGEGQAAARLSSDAFFVWLSLDPSKFWVNLDPREPDRVVDAELGKTDVGRVLLEADLEMKRLAARLSDPRTKLGARIWREMTGECVSTRGWIVPGPAKIRESGDSLYIVDAPLVVKTEAMYRSDRPGTRADCPGVPQASHRHNERVNRRLILPRIQEAVDSAPEFADLRRVYVARVAAEWYRGRTNDNDATFGRFVDSGDIDAWQTTTGWRPEQTYRAYLRSYREKEYKVTTTVQLGNVTRRSVRSAGGVIFDRVELAELDRQAASRAWPGHEDSVRSSLTEPTRGGPDGGVLLGGKAAPPPGTHRPQQPEPAGTATWIWLAAPAAAVVVLLGLAVPLLRRRKAA